jgi:excisionase family DNA binding protein
MEDLLTTRQVQELLQVDRITVYRMLQDGRLKGVKIGQQWRFPSREVERLIDKNCSNLQSINYEAGRRPFPSHCVQAIQNLFADLSQVGVVTINLQGEPLTEPNPSCEFCALMLSNPTGHQACQLSWRELVRHSIQKPGWFTCHAGMQYFWAPIRENEQMVAALLAGQVYTNTPDPKDQNKRMRYLVKEYGMDPQQMAEPVGQIPIVDAYHCQQIEQWPALAARAVESILVERSALIERLQKIAEISQIG